MATLLRWNHPAWIVAGCGRAIRSWERVLQANNAHAPMALRVESTKCAAVGAIPASASSYQFRSKSRRGRRAWSWPSPCRCKCCRGLLMARRRCKTLLPSWPRLVLQGLDLTPAAARAGCLRCAGWQDSASAGTCAAGSPLQVTALEVDESAARASMTRWRGWACQAQVLVADASRPQDWWQSPAAAPFDAILLDAPCTASGIVRRHPDVRWLRRESDVAQLAQPAAARFWKRCGQLLKPGGRLLYCTCSVFKAEGDLQIQTFLAHNTNAQLLPSPGHLIPGVGKIRACPGQSGR